MVEGWVSKKISELFVFSGGLSASRAELSDKGVCYLHYGDIHGTSQSYVDVEKDRGALPKLDIPLRKVSKDSLLSDGDVVFVDASEDDEGASKHVVVRNLGNTPFISGLHTIVAKPRTNELTNLFREYCFQSNDIKNQIKFYAAGTKVVGISKSNLGKITLTFPVEKKEQDAIAQALSDMDSLIKSLKKLIKKKKVIKQGAIQELFTGGKRLLGFEGGLRTYKLNEVFDVYAGGDVDVEHYSKHKTNIHLHPVYSNSLFELGLYGFTSLPKYKADSITITGRGVSVGYATYRPQDFDAIIRLLVITPKQKGIVNTQYITNLINQFISFPMENTGVPQLTTLQIQNVELSFPSFEEQTAIANIISDMDAEIEQLEKKLAKCCLIKKGMLQELLTGRIRLVKPMV